MDILLLPFRLLYKFYLLLFFSVTLILSYPVFKVLLSKEKWFPVAFRLMRIYAWAMLVASGIILKVRGRENILSGEPYIICANHSSFMDIPCIYGIFPEYFVFTGKKEIEKWPLFRIFYTSGMNISIDRHNQRKTLQGFRDMMNAVKKGNPLVIFPEGTVSRTAPELSEFKPGAATIAIQQQIPIIPVTIKNNWKRLQRKGFLSGKAGPGVTEVEIHPAISTVGLTKEDVEALNYKLKNIIESAL